MVFGDTHSDVDVEGAYGGDGGGLPAADSGPVRWARRRQAGYTRAGTNLRRSDGR